MVRLIALFVLAACTGPGDAPPGRPTPSESGPPLRIPADEPTWARLTGLQDHPGAYGEASWDDVRMRVVGHLATIGRDRARNAAMSGDYSQCADDYREAADRVRAASTRTSTGAPIRAALLSALERDAGFCAALAAHTPPPDPGVGVAHLRARWYGLAHRAAQGGDVRSDAIALAAEARAFPPPALALDGFADFEARHALRVKLVEAWADAVDPLFPAEPWGYWEPSEVTRVTTTIADAAAGLAGPPGRAWPPDPAVLSPPHPRIPFTAEALGALPTGDSLVDVVGYPGPRAIGSLSLLSLDDPAHRGWLTERATVLESLPSAEVPAAVNAMVAVLDGYPHGSRYYNIKQVRNSTVRALASRGDYADARTVLTTNWPLHAQDWACPDRAAILRGIEGRLLIAARHPDASATLDQALAEAGPFLAHIAAREAAGPKPHAIGGGRPPALTRP